MRQFDQDGSVDDCRIPTDSHKDLSDIEFLQVTSAQIEASPDKSSEQNDEVFG